MINLPQFETGLNYWRDSFASSWKKKEKEKNEIEKNEIENKKIMRTSHECKKMITSKYLYNDTGTFF